MIYARKCDVTGVGMNEGWCWGDGEFYTATVEDTIAELRKDNSDKDYLTDDELFDWAYDADILYWTDWYDEDLVDQEYYYTADGEEVLINIEDLEEDETFMPGTEVKTKIKNENKMDILHYTIDLKDLFDTQDRQLVVNKTTEDEKQEEFKRNKKELLKYVLPLMHGIYALHNRKCNKSTSSVTGEVGLLGLGKVNIEEKLNFIVESDFYFKDNGATFDCSVHGNAILRDNVQVWLNKKGKYIHTPNLAYSMISLTRAGNSVYGMSLEDELLKVAKECAIYTEEWKNR